MRFLKHLKPTKKKILILLGLIVVTVIEYLFFFDFFEVNIYVSLFQYLESSITVDILFLFYSIYAIALYIFACLISLINRKNVLSALILIIISILILYGTPFLFTQKPLKNPENDRVDMTVINNIINREHYDNWPIVSWNTKRYGRIYAEICDAPFSMFPYIGCLDGGINYYDRKGVKIANCESMGNDEVLFGYYLCRFLIDVKYEDSDYSYITENMHLIHEDDYVLPIAPTY
ncbi:MAG: hypothetical protein WC528_05150 [Patescibacteria group bacterium]